MIIFNGTSSEEVGVIVEHYPSIVFPKRRVEVFKIPGRNGDRIIDQDVFDNYNQTYSVFFDSKFRGGLEAAVPKIASWLFSGTGYGRLEDSYYPEFYRMAYVPEASEFLAYFTDYGQGSLSFNCMPERWYKYGEVETEIQSGQIFYNPSGFKALPYFRWTLSNGTATITLTHLDTNVVDTFQISGNGFIDSKEHTSNVDLTEKYEKIYFGKETKVEWTTSLSGSVFRLYITPRWWTI